MAEKLGSVKPRALNALARVPGGAELIKQEGGVVPNAAPVTPPSPPAAVSTVADPADDFKFDVSAPSAPQDAVKPVVPPVAVKPVVADAPQDVEAEIDGLAEPKDTVAAENFRKLRTKAKSEYKERRRLQTELEQTMKKVKDYETGVALPEVVQQQTNRIAELEKYEQLFNFRGSPVYQEKFGKPIEQDTTALNKIAADYGVSSEVVDAVLATDNTADLDRMLSQSFPNTIGAMEAKTLISRIRATRNAAAEAERNAASSSAQLQQENDAIINSRKRQAHEAISHVARKAWDVSVGSLNEDERFTDIHWRHGDTEHNEMYVKPVLTKASQEFGRTVRMLAEHGLTNLPEELAIKLAKSDQLAHYSAVLVHERNELAKQVAELKQALKRTTSITRPSLHGGTSSPSSSYMNGAALAPNQAVGADRAGSKVLARVLGK